jgi:hypothetical protein
MYSPRHAFYNMTLGACDPREDKPLLAWYKGHVDGGLVRALTYARRGIAIIATPDR